MVRKKIFLLIGTTYLSGPAGNARESNERESERGQRQKAQDPSEEEGKWAVDAKRVGNETRFINHSEDRANVAAECVGSNGSNNEHRLIYIKAIRDIKADEELLWNYGKNFDPAAF